jgi:hypothetical protein
VSLTAALVEHGALVRTDGVTGVDRSPGDRLAAPVGGHPYVLGDRAGEVLGWLGVDLAALLDRPRSARPLMRFCVDWSEQRHHVAGALGAAILSALEETGWVRRRSSGRALDVTDEGARRLEAAFGIQPAA